MDLLPKIVPEGGRYPHHYLITHEEQYFGYKYPFILVAHPIKMEQMTNYALF